MHRVNTVEASVHRGEGFMVQKPRKRNLLKLFFVAHRRLRTSVFTASVDHVAGWESTQGSYHTKYTPMACPGAMGIMC